MALLPKLKTDDGALLDFPKLKVGAVADVAGAPNEGAAWVLSVEAVVAVEVVVTVLPKENRPVPATKVGPVVQATVVVVVAVVVPKLVAVGVLLATVVEPKLKGFTAAVDVLLEPKAGGGSDAVAGIDPKVKGAGVLVMVAAGGE